MLLGMNTTGVFNWEANAPYNNAFDIWEPEWGVNASKPYDRSVLAPLDVDGLPLSGTAATFSYMWGYPAGDYELAIRGQFGSVKVGGKLAAASSLSQPDQDGWRRMTVRLTPREQIAWITITDIVNGIEGLKLWVPDCDRTQRWTKWYLDKLRPLSSLRFLDAFGTNGDPKAKWSDRSIRLESTFSIANAELKGQFDKGQPYEDAIDLCNQLGCACWVTTPYLPFVNKDLDYIEQMARLFLGLKGKVIVETGNELWNRAGGFGQGQWLINEAGWNYNQAATMAASWEYEYAKIWNQVWGEAGRLGDCLPVKGCQASSPKWAELGLQFLAKAGVKVDDVFYGMHYANYATGDGPDESTIQANLMDDATRQRTTNDDHKALAKTYGLQILNYEGGPYLSGNSNWQTKLNVYRGPVMEGAYRGVIAEAERSGSVLFNHFCGPYVRPAAAGTWGLGDTANQAPLPKETGWDTAVQSHSKGELPARKVPERKVSKVVVRIEYSDGSSEEYLNSPKGRRSL